MKYRRILVAVALLTSLASAGPLAHAHKARVFIGLSNGSSSLTGFAGIGGMTLHCQNTFGKKAHVCTSAEILASDADINSGAGWVQPVILGGATSGFAVDVSGVSAPGPENLSCDGWKSTDPTNETGLIVETNGKFHLSACNMARRVACCK